jgi:hypothetical protein
MVTERASMRRLLLCGILVVVGCGGGSAAPTGSMPPPNGTCVRANGPYIVTCNSFICSDGTGSCAQNAPTVTVNLSGTGVMLAAIANWTLTGDQWSTNNCNEAVTEMNPGGDTANLELLCNADGSSCGENMTFTFAKGGECTESLQWTRN